MFFFREPSLGKENVDATLPQTGQDEDCLTLNVWAPKGVDKKKPLPVLLWIHGGGFTEGSSSVPCE
jgi:para-nitrobenzyl esterase